MPREASQSEKWDFEVEQVPAPHPHDANRKTGYFYNVRKDTGEVLGVTSEQYGLLQNKALVEAAIAALESRGLKNWDQRILVAGDSGQRLFAKFTFKDKQLAIGGVGDLVGYAFTFVNSFDRSLRAALELGFERLTCSNGMTTLERELSITRKHSSQISVDFIGEAIDQALEKGPKALEVFEKLSKVPMTDEQGTNVIKNLVAKNIISGVIGEAIVNLWLHPHRPEDKDRTMFNLYNAVTEHLTHNVSKNRFEYADKTSGGVLLSLVNAVHKPEVLTKLILPPPSDKVVLVAQGPVIDVEVVQP